MAAAKARPLEAQTRDHHQGILNRELLPTFGDRELSTITAADVRAWYASAMVDKPTLRALSSYPAVNTASTPWPGSSPASTPHRPEQVISGRKGAAEKGIKSVETNAPGATVVDKPG